MVSELPSRIANRRHYAIHALFSDYTMIPRARYLHNLGLAERARALDGAVVECGVWRGGMIAGIAKLLGPGRNYVLFDSFEGLPPATAADGEKAIAWQADTTASDYFNNCSAEVDEAKAAMRLAGVEQPDIHQGWFDTTVPMYAASGGKIALLRLDGDWYDSTLVCLNHLFPLVVSSGVVIVDDYGAWEGCTRAVHRYLADNNRPEAISRTPSGVAYLIKN
jgi:O-methyltransferase